MILVGRLTDISVRYFACTLSNIHLLSNNLQNNLYSLELHINYCGYKTKNKSHKIDRLVPVNYEQTCIFVMQIQRHKLTSRSSFASFARLVFVEKNSRRTWHGWKNSFRQQPQTRVLINWIMVSLVANLFDITVKFSVDKIFLLSF